MHRYLIAILCVLVGLEPALGAPSANSPFGGKGIPVKGFKVAEPYGPPNEGQTKSRLEGGKALVLPDGSAVLSDGVIFHALSKTNTLQLIVRADECFYNSTNRVITSAGPIHMETADGKFTIEGTGFFLQQSNSSLVISNNVHTVIQSALLQSASTNTSENATPGEGGPLFIDSVRFTYDGSSGQGVWLEKVRVVGTNLDLHSAVLTATVPMDDVDHRQVRALLAERDVALKYSGISATGGRLNYAPDTGLIRLSDRAQWKTEETEGSSAGQREGSGDELVIDRTNHIFQVNRHAWLKLPGQTLGESGFLSQSNSPARKSVASAQSSIEIACDSYEIRTNWAEFRNQVRLDEYVGKAARGWLTCRDMAVTFAGTNLQTLTANKDVVLKELDLEGKTNRFTGGRAFYTHTNTTLEMTQNPTWQSGPRSGKGDLLRVNTQANEMLVSGNAYLRLPARELASQLAPTLTGGTTNRPPRMGTNEFAEIYCEEYTLKTANSVFRGGVYVTHPEMNWSCERLTAQVSMTGLTNIIAEENVVFDFLTQSGPFHGTGDNAVYEFGVLNTHTNGTVPINELRLTGTPAVLTNAIKGGFRNPLVIWDRAKGKINLPGSDYKIEGFAKAIDTNIFVLPNKKLTK